METKLNIASDDWIPKELSEQNFKTYSVEGYHNVRMILVLSTQRFSLLILISDGNVFSVISTFEQNWPSSECFAIRFLERSSSAFT